MLSWIAIDLSFESVYNTIGNVKPFDNPPRFVKLAARVIPGYTERMKTAISLPDETFDRASRRAKDLGLSRSEFFARAATNYLDELDARSVTEQIDAALQNAVQDAAHDDSNEAAVEAAHDRLFGADDEW